LTRVKSLVVCAVAAVVTAPVAASARSFAVTQEVSVARPATLWIPLPQDDPWQRITDLSVSGKWERVYDERWGNAFARVTAAPGTSVTLSFRVERAERGADPSRATGKDAPDGYARWLAADARVPLDARVQKIAADVMRGKTTPAAKARAAYDYVLSTMKYDKPTGEGQRWGQGDILWACDKRYGNCTDFHALFIGLLRAANVPARFSIGYAIPTGAAAQLPGYHCWADFYLDGVGWVPVDASEAWKHPEKREYFFGHHDADRVQLTTGRDVPLPGMRGAPVNFIVYPYAEADGAPVEVTRKTLYAPQ
jgi:transglutaminase-like putative cysteine protease